MRQRCLLAGALMLGLLPAAAHAQLSLEPAVDVGSGFHFRGLTLTNRPVVQPSLTLGLAAGEGVLELTLWSNLEPADYDGAREISALDGRAGFTEVDVEAHASHAFGRLELGAGAIVYLYAEPRDGEAETPTTELVASATWDATVSPSLALYQDLGTVRGLYAEAGLAYAVERWGGIALDAVLGYSRGEADGETAYYARDGFTHAELGAALPLQAGPVALEPSLRAILAIDPETRITAPARERRFRLLAGLSLGWAGRE